MPKTKISDDAKFITFVATAPLALVQTTMEHAKAVLAGRLKLTNLTTTTIGRTRSGKTLPAGATTNLQPVAGGGYTNTAALEQRTA